MSDDRAGAGGKRKKRRKKIPPNVGGELVQGPAPRRVEPPLHFSPLRFLCVHVLLRVVSRPFFSYLLWRTIPRVVVFVPFFARALFLHYSVGPVSLGATPFFVIALSFCLVVSFLFLPFPSPFLCSEGTMASLGSGAGKKPTHFMDIEGLTYIRWINNHVKARG